MPLLPSVTGCVTKKKNFQHITFSAKTLFQSDADQIITCHFILISSLWLHRVPTTTTQTPRWPDYSGEIRGRRLMWSFSLSLRYPVPSPPRSLRWKCSKQPVWCVQQRNFIALQEHLEGEEVCREWVWIFSFFPPLPLWEEDVQPTVASWTTTTRAVMGPRHGKHSSEKNNHRYVDQDQTSHLGVKKILLPLHSWWIWSTHKPREKRPLSVSVTPTGIQHNSPPQIFFGHDKSWSRTAPFSQPKPGSRPLNFTLLQTRRRELTLHSFSCQIETKKHWIF